MTIELTSFTSRQEGNSLILENAFKAGGVSHSIRFEKLDKGADWDLSQLEKIRQIYVENIYPIYKEEVTYRPPAECSVEAAKGFMQRISAALFRAKKPETANEELRGAQIPCWELMDTLRREQPDPQHLTTAMDGLLRVCREHETKYLKTDLASGLSRDLLELWRWFCKRYWRAFALGDAKAKERAKTAAFYAVNASDLTRDKDTTYLQTALANLDPATAPSPQRRDQSGFLVTNEKE